MSTAPRPYLVRPKTPLMRRAGTKVILVVLGWALVFGFLVMADAQSDADRRREGISEFTSLVEAQLYQGGAAQQSFAGPLILPQVGEALSQLQAGGGDPQELAENTASWSEVAARAGDGIGGIDTDLAGLREARNLMEHGLRLYSGLARQVGIAAELEGRTRRTPGGDRGTADHRGHDLRHGVRRPAGGAPAGRPPHLDQPPRRAPRRLRRAAADPRWLTWPGWS